MVAARNHRTAYCQHRQNMLQERGQKRNEEHSKGFWDSGHRSPRMEKRLKDMD